MLDTAIIGGQVVDGTGAPAILGDVGIKDGLIVEMGALESSATQTIDVEGLVVTPGFVDPHTHYDAQLFWDPLATPSSWHGVTTVVAGNCGFTLAPLGPGDADYTARMLAQVEGMPLASLAAGVPWGWESFGDYLDALDGNIAVNAGFMVGHCALRRYVLGEDFARESSVEERDRMMEVLRQSLASGGTRSSSSRSATHNDGDGQPVPSRWASEEELLALCEVVGQADGTSLEVIIDGCLAKFSDEDIEFMAQMTALAQRPLNWNVLYASSDDPERAAWQLRPSIRARELGGRVVALTMPVLADMNLSFLTTCALWHIPGWRDVLSVDVPERIRRLKDPDVRANMLTRAQVAPWDRFADFSRYVIGDVVAPENERYRQRNVGEIAAERGQDAFSTVVEIAAADELATVLWPPSEGDTDADWQFRSTLWEDQDVLLGASDAGAHLDRMLGSPYPSRFLADTLRGRQLVSLERAVQLMTDVPARLFGLRGRGRIAPNYSADVVVFDPGSVGSGPAWTAFDLPGDSKRLVADAIGIHSVMVNGREILTGGQPTGDLPGLVLRSGRDTSGGMR